MVWVKDFEEKWVNLDNWDFFDYITWEDKEKNGETCFYEYYVSKSNGDEHLLGYVSSKHDAEDDIRLMISGHTVYLSQLSSVIYFYTDDEFEKQT